jgi:hypothetical protein
VLEKVPVFLEKTGTEAVRPRAGIIVHGEEGVFDFIEGERANERGSLGRGNRGGLNKGGEVKNIAGGEGGSKEVLEEPMEDGGFRRVGESDVPVVSLEILNLVFLKTAGGAEMEVARILIAEGAVFDFCALPPI